MCDVQTAGSMSTLTHIGSNKHIERLLEELGDFDAAFIEGDNSPDDGFPITVAVLEDTADFHFDLGYDIDHLISEAATVRPRFDSV